MPPACGVVPAGPAPEGGFGAKNPAGQPSGRVRSRFCSWRRTGGFFFLRGSDRESGSTLLLVRTTRGNDLGRSWLLGTGGALSDGHVCAALNAETPKAARGAHSQGLGSSGPREWDLVFADRLSHIINQMAFPCLHPLAMVT